METIVLEVQSNVARQFNGLSLTEKRFYFDLFERLFLNRNRSEEEHQKAVKDLMKTVEAIGLRAEERGMTDEIFAELMKED